EYHRTTILNNLHRALSLARQSATYREQIVTLCPLSGGYGSCSGDWSQPISVFYDPDNRRALTDPSLLIYELPAPASGTLTASSAAKRYFQFRPDGLNRGTLGSITWCPPDNDARRAGRLILNLAGRVRHARATNGDGIPEDSDGRPLRCPAS
ncbi:MAG: GspH/FimT family protein, partial [Gammaproteobacteria bacterium]|nr:GspH/FimT family protein [Gammaproteobacteria bacterium]